MSKRVLATVALVALALMCIGLLWLDLPLARWVHDSGLAASPLMVGSIGVLDTIFGVKLSYWLASSLCIVVGTALLVISRNRLRYRLPGQTLVSVALVQASTNLLMILGKNTFGRVRPVDLLASTDWSAMWFMGGGSFPSGHGAFYFGLLLPLAASTSRVWLRTLLLGIAVFVVLARINMERHYLSDVCASALIAACVALTLRALLQQFKATAVPAVATATR